jgi:hypothetical protein
MCDWELPPDPFDPADWPVREMGDYAGVAHDITAYGVAYVRVGPPSREVHADGLLERRLELPSVAP